MPWAETIAQVRSGKLDFNPGIFMNEERKTVLDFSNPFYEQDIFIFYHKSKSSPTDLKALEGKRLGVVKADFMVNYLKVI